MNHSTDYFIWEKTSWKNKNQQQINKQKKKENTQPRKWQSALQNWNVNSTHNDAQLNQTYKSTSPHWWLGSGYRRIFPENEWKSEKNLYLSRICSFARTELKLPIYTRWQCQNVSTQLNRCLLSWNVRAMKNRRERESAFFTLNSFFIFEWKIVFHSIFLSRCLNIWHISILCWTHTQCVLSFYPVEWYCISDHYIEFCVCLCEYGYTFSALYRFTMALEFIQTEERKRGYKDLEDFLFKCCT